MRAARERTGPAGVRAAHLRDKYGISMAEYDALHHRCAICGTHRDDIEAPRTGQPTAEAVRLVVDHCHRSRRVRVLLCDSGDPMVGLARDRPEILCAGADYLEAMP